MGFLPCRNPPLGCLGVKSNAKINTDNIGCLFDSKTLPFANIQTQKWKQNFARNISSKHLLPQALHALLCVHVWLIFTLKTPVAIKRLLCLSFTTDERWGRGFLKQIFFKN